MCTYMHKFMCKIHNFWCIVACGLFSLSLFDLDCIRLVAWIFHSVSNTTRYIFWKRCCLLLKSGADSHMPRMRQTEMEWPLIFRTITLISMVAIDRNATLLSNNMHVTKRTRSLWNSVCFTWMCNKYVVRVFIYFTMWYRFVSIYIMSVSNGKFVCKNINRFVDLSHRMTTAKKNRFIQCCVFFCELLWSSERNANCSKRLWNLSFLMIIVNDSRYISTIINMFARTSRTRCSIWMGQCSETNQKYEFGPHTPKEKRNINQ